MEQMLLDGPICPKPKIYATPLNSKTFLEAIGPFDSQIDAVNACADRGVGEWTLYAVESYMNVTISGTKGLRSGIA